MPENNNNETYQPMTFDSIRLGLHPLRKFLNGLTVRCLSRRQLTTELLSLNATVCSAKRFSDLVKTGNATVVNTRKSAIKVLSATDAALK